MAEDTYRKAFDEAVNEFQGLYTRRVEIDERLNQLRPIVVSLGRLIGDENVVESELSSTSLTRAVANVLSRTKKSLTPSEIRDELVADNFDTSRYKSVIPTIVKVLERLHEKRHVAISEGKRGETKKKLYSWKTIQPTGSVKQSFSLDEFLMEIGKPIKEVTEEND